MKPAGFENSQGIITAAYLKDPTDKQWDNDAEMKMWRDVDGQVHAGRPTRPTRNYIYAYAVVVPDARDAEEVRRRR